jgi:hypothetical protein
VHARISDPKPPRNQNAKRDASKALSGAFYNGHPIADTAEEPATVLSLRCVPGFGAQGQRATRDLASEPVAVE